MLKFPQAIMISALRSRKKRGEGERDNQKNRQKVCISSINYVHTGNIRTKADQFLSR